jgi:homoserine dehydrogenase
MRNIAILGFGVVGSGVADLLTRNKAETERLGGDKINIKYILDLRDFPGSPFESLVVHDFETILSDKEVDTVIEVMGGSHPAYEYTMAALKAGKNVITSNKEVVANFGDQFLAAAKDSGASYRFEAAVGGGIPVISPMISMVGQNKITEIRGILNGTTNYILTKMFREGEDFDSALKDAQAKGYAERNPDADVLGTDACRKISILTSLVCGRLMPTENIHTEGITRIRTEDVRCAESVGLSIKLLGRCLISDEGISIVVAPFMLPATSPLGGVSGVYNAVEIVGEPIGNLMFYGQGAGAGATASAVVGDLMQIMCSGRSVAQPTMVKTSEGLLDFSRFTAKQYLALEGVGKDEIEKIFGEVKYLSEGEEIAFITEEICEGELLKKLCGLTVKSRIRLV